MLASLSRCISKPLKLLAIRDCVNVVGTGLEPLRYIDFTQAEYLDLSSLATVHRDGVTSKVMSTLIDILPAARMTLKFLRLPEGWLAVFPLQYKDCVGDCCSEERQWTWAREWCHRCGSGPYCELSGSLVMCKATGEKFCKNTCVLGDDWGDPTLVGHIIMLQDAHLHTLGTVINGIVSVDAMIGVESDVLLATESFTVV